MTEIFFFTFETVIVECRAYGSCQKNKRLSTIILLYVGLPNIGKPLV